MLFRGVLLRGLDLAASLLVFLFEELTELFFGLDFDVSFFLFLTDRVFVDLFLLRSLWLISTALTFLTFGTLTLELPGLLLLEGVMTAIFGI